MAMKHDGLKLIIRILKRIIDDPNNLKYQNLDYKKVQDKLKHCPNLIDLLFNAGFYKSGNNQRLLFNINSLDTLKLIYDQLISGLVMTTSVIFK